MVGGYIVVVVVFRETAVAESPPTSPSRKSDRVDLEHTIAHVRRLLLYYRSVRLEQHILSESDTFKNYKPLCCLVGWCVITR